MAALLVFYAPAIFLFATAYAALRDNASFRRRDILALLAVSFVLVASYFEVRHLRGVVPRLLVSYGFAGGLCLVAAWTLILNRLVRCDSGS